MDPLTGESTPGSRASRPVRVGVPSESKGRARVRARTSSLRVEVVRENIMKELFDMFLDVPAGRMWYGST